MRWTDKVPASLAGLRDNVTNEILELEPDKMRAMRRGDIPEYARLNGREAALREVRAVIDKMLGKGGDLSRVFVTTVIPEGTPGTVSFSAAGTEEDSR